ncbi:MAG: serine hydrolase [Candidatus Zixiibacteriota bacterium]|nr:MAG: serine hydrolase [candidate division Zixibacteria bacterium]
MRSIELFLAVVVLCLISNVFLYAGENPVQSIWYTDNGEQKIKDIGTPLKSGEGILLSGDCSDYIDLTAQPLPIIVGGSTVGATNDYGPFPSRPLCWSESGWWASSGNAPDVTYKWTAPYHGRFKISLLESNYDTVLLLYNFTCPTEPVYPDDFICGNDDFGGAQSQLSYVPLDEGQEVLIVVDGYAGHTGDYVLWISAIQTSPVDSFVVDMMDTYPIPGLQACVIKDGDIIWTGSYGDAYIDFIDVTDSTIFALASVSKTVTGTALMQLNEDGLIGLDDDINNYLPFSVENPYYPGTIITPRMLMAHVSSIKDNYNVTVPLICPGDSPVPLDTFLVNYLVPGGYYYSIQNFNNWAPAARYNYTNVGNSLAALLVELTNPDSLSFDQYCQDHIFTPLGMNKTGWFLADFADTLDIAMPYDWNGYYYSPLGHYGQPHYPAVQLRSSALQMARLLTAYMQYGQIDTVRILDSSSVALMNTIQYPGIDKGVGHPGDAGIGWFNIEMFDMSIWGHLGRMPGRMTGMFFCREDNTGAVVLSNEDFLTTLPFPDANMFVIYELLKLASGWPYGYISGTVIDAEMNPIETVYINAIGTGACAFSDASGEYMLHYLDAGTYDISFSHDYYSDTTVTGVAVTAGDTVELDVQMVLVPCDYITGDVNGSDSYNGLDITYGVNYFKGTGPDPACPECGLCPDWHYCGDVNSSCSYNGLDITYGVNYFKGGADPIPCADCPPVE